MGLGLAILPQSLAICRLEKKLPIPGWALSSSQFLSITSTFQEISIVCDESVVPPDVKAVKGWRAFKVEGQLDLSMTGVISALTGPLAASGISVFSVSTYETDYLLVKSERFDEAAKILSHFFELK